MRLGDTRLTESDRGSLGRGAEGDKVGRQLTLLGEILGMGLGMLRSHWWRVASQGAWRVNLQLGVGSRCCGRLAV